MKINSFSEKVLSKSDNTETIPVNCPYCNNTIKGKFCHNCGEKLFTPSQLSSKSFFENLFHELVTPYDNKLLKSFYLLFKKPGHLTRENIRGVRIPYAKPLQLFLVANLIFYLLVNYFQRTDYTPSIQDSHSSYISDRPLLGFLAPIDMAIGQGLDQLRKQKLDEYRTEFAANTTRNFIPFTGNIKKEFNELQVELLYYQAYNQKVSFLSKTLIIILIPILALFLFITFGRKIKYYGVALILATHFLIFNILLYTILTILNFLPGKLFEFEELTRIPNKLITIIFYNDYLTSVSNFILGIYQGFEAIHIILWTTWFFFAFKNLFRIHWFKNLLISYLLSRIFFIIIFCLYKKFLIAWALWSI